MTTVENFVDLMIDPCFFSIEIYSCCTGETVYKGRAEEIPDEYLDAEIMTIDCPVDCSLCINIE